MKILFLHCDYLKFRALKKALKEPEELKSKELIEVKEPLGVFVAVEKSDENDKEKVIGKLVENVLELKDKVNAKNVVLYPYAHLSSSLSNPDFALDVLQRAEDVLKKKKIKIYRAPFGYYKEFELKCKGHPLAELSREIKIGEGNLTSKKEKVREEQINEQERLNLVKKLSKITMQTPLGNNNQKSNVQLGRELDIYIVSEIVGSGLPLFTPKGATIKREIERFIIDEEIKRGYEHTSTPVMAKSDLYKVSGHWQHYKESMFALNVGNDVFALRPMTCPFQFILYKRKPRSYKELPKKYAEVATLFRNEQSGELRGLTRMRQFTLADGHIICRPEQLEEQFEEVLDLIKFSMEKLGVKDIWYRFSKWDPKDKEKYIDDSKAWDKSQKIMKKILDRLKIKYKEAEGEAAFYGPKLDLQYKDVFGKEDTLLTIQIDFALPERFDLTYTDKDNKEKRPMIIHRSVSGATERMISYLLEKTQGNLPVWLSPIQARVISFTDRNIKASEKVLESLKEAGIRTDCDFESTTVSEKVRDAEIKRIPYMIVIGDKEEKEGEVAVRKRGERKIVGMKVDKLIEEIMGKVKNKS